MYELQSIFSALSSVGAISGPIVNWVLHSKAARAAKSQNAATPTLEEFNDLLKEIDRIEDSLLSLAEGLNQINKAFIQYIFIRYNPTFTDADGNTIPAPDWLDGFLGRNPEHASPLPETAQIGEVAVQPPHHGQ
jgi:hypothetical protein